MALVLFVWSYKLYPFLKVVTKAGYDLVLNVATEFGGLCEVCLHHEWHCAKKLEKTSLGKNSFLIGQTDTGLIFHQLQ